MNERRIDAKSKFRKTSVLLRDSSIAPYLPETFRFSAGKLLQMLREHGVVYVKPDRGRFGHGVMRVAMLPTPKGTGYRLNYRSKARVYISYDELLSAVNSIQGQRAYIVQRGINLLTHRGRPFDIRVMVQKSPEGTWKTTGYVARVAAPRRIVTNFYGGGTAMELVHVLQPYLSRLKAAVYIRSLCRLGELVAVRSHQAWPFLKAVGLDIAIDQEMRSWILEVNSQPLADVFAKLKDKTMYRRMRQYANAPAR